MAFFKLKEHSCKESFNFMTVPIRSDLQAAFCFFSSNVSSLIIGVWEADDWVSNAGSDLGLAIISAFCWSNPDSSGALWTVCLTEEPDNAANFFNGTLLGLLRAFLFVAILEAKIKKNNIRRMKLCYQSEMKFAITTSH